MHGQTCGKNEFNASDSSGAGCGADTYIRVFEDGISWARPLPSEMKTTASTSKCPRCSHKFATWAMRAAGCTASCSSPEKDVKLNNPFDDPFNFNFDDLMGEDESDYRVL